MSCQTGSLSLFSKPPWKASFPLYVFVLALDCTANPLKLFSPLAITSTANNN